MTSRDRRRENLGALVGVAVKAAVQDAIARTRTPMTLSGTVEAISEDKDVVYVRMDNEALGTDPTESINYGNPGVLPMTRMGETYTGDVVRAVFEQVSGASATRTSSENMIVLPYGAESGRRIVLDGNLGTITLYDDDDEIVGIIHTDVLAIGNVGTSGARATLDPVGGLRIRSANDALVTTIDQQGYTLRDATTGLVTFDIKPGSLRMVDPTGTDDVEIVTSSGGTLPNPAYRVAAEVNPGASLTAPAAPLFPTKPLDDIEIAHVAAWIRATNQAATMTPPAGHTERLDGNFQDAAGTLQVSVADRDVATGLTGDFTSTQSNWQHAIGTRVVIKGGGTVSPSFRSVATSQQVVTGSTVVASVPKPAGLAVGDVMLAFISMGVNGGFVPTGWVTPPGFVQLGALPSSSGTGATQSTLATGVWAKLADAADVAATEFQTTINLPSGTKMLHAAMVAIQAPFLVPGGVQIRLAGKPIRRELDRSLLDVASRTLCDFQNISQAYDNLEIVIDGVALGGGAAQQLILRFNNDNLGHYAWQTVRNATLIAGGGPGLTEIRMGGLSGTAGSRTSGRVNIIGYKTSGKPTAVNDIWWTDGLSTFSERGAGQWDGNAGVSAINRITIIAAVGPNPQFAVGSRAILYGY